jgi:hypothetical protein
MQRRPSRLPSKDNLRQLKAIRARKAITDRKTALADLAHAVGHYRKLAESKPLTLQGSDYAHAVLELNKAIDRADTLLQ